MRPTALCLIALLLLAGCRGGKGGKKAPRPTPSPSPFAFNAQVGRFETVMPDGKGGRLALVRGVSGKIGAEFGGSPHGAILGTQAILYRNNRPVLQIDAPRIVPDFVRRTVTASGVVTARTLEPGQTTLLRSDTMTWRAAADTLTGLGKVLLTRGETVQVPAERFTADTRLSRVEFTFGPAPATGKL